MFAGLEGKLPRAVTVNGSLPFWMAKWIQPIPIFDLSSEPAGSCGRHKTRDLKWKLFLQQRNTMTFGGATKETNGYPVSTTVYCLCKLSVSNLTDLTQYGIGAGNRHRAPIIHSCSVGVGILIALQESMNAPLELVKTVTFRIKLATGS